MGLVRLLVIPGPRPGAARPRGVRKLRKKRDKQLEQQVEEKTDWTRLLVFFAVLCFVSYYACWR